MSPKGQASDQCTKRKFKKGKKIIHKNAFQDTRERCRATSRSNNKKTEKKKQNTSTKIDVRLDFVQLCILKNPKCLRYANYCQISLLSDVKIQIWNRHLREDRLSFNIQKKYKRSCKAYCGSNKPAVLAQREEGDEEGMGDEWN